MVSVCILFFFFFKQKTAYEMRISDWSSDVCSSDLLGRDVDRQAGGERLASNLAGGRRASSLDPAIGIARTGGEAAFAGASGHGADLPTRGRSISAASAAISRVARLSASISDASRPDCAALAQTTRWEMEAGSNS